MRRLMTDAPTAGMPKPGAMGRILERLERRGTGFASVERRRLVTDYGLLQPVLMPPWWRWSLCNVLTDRGT